MSEQQQNTFALLISAEHRREAVYTLLTAIIGFLVVALS